MKKIRLGKGIAVLGLAVLCGLIAGCSTLAADLERDYGGARHPDSAPHQALHWAVSAFVDEWGDKTGDYYVHYLKDVDAEYSKYGSNEEQTMLKELTFSGSGLFFYVNSILLLPFGAEDVLFNIKFPDGKTEEFKGHKRESKRNDAYPMVFIPYSEELVNALLQKNIAVRFVNGNGIFRCQFNFPAQFEEAYELLKSKK